MMLTKEEIAQAKDEINQLLTRVNDLKSRLPKNHNTEHIKHAKHSEEFFNLFKLPQIHQTFTVRESEILLFLAKGLSNQAIGDHLFITEKAVKFHMTKIFKKLQLKTRLEVGFWLSNLKKGAHPLA